MKHRYATTVINTFQDRDGVRFVCQYCGRMSGVRADDSMDSLPLGWQIAPYPATTQHADGSSGALFTCPTCVRRRDFPIPPREYLR